MSTTAITPQCYGYAGEVEDCNSPAACSDSLGNSLPCNENLADQAAAASGTAGLTLANNPITPTNTNANPVVASSSSASNNSGVSSLISSLGSLGTSITQAVTGTAPKTGVAATTNPLGSSSTLILIAVAVGAIALFAFAGKKKV